MEFGEFFRQMPPQIILAPVIFGILYVALTIHIFRRAAAKRRAKREAAAAGLPTPPALDKPKRMGFPFASLLRGELPDKPLTPAAWTVPSEMRNVPEPDLDMLVAPMLMEQPAENAPEPDVSAALVASGADWITAVTPETTSSISTINSDREIDMEQENVELGDAVEVMRVWRDLSDGSLIVQMGNQRYRTLAEIQNQDLARRFVAVVRELWAIINTSPARITGSQPAAPDTSSLTAGTSKRPRLGLLNAEPEQPQTGKPGVLKQMARSALGQSSTPKSEEPAGIANAVEDYLQFKLSSTPQFAERSIHIRTSHDHGVRIEVDGHYYDAIGDVIDPDVREFLFAMMREWEARH
jgi:hypothetical protein